jgi:hypothetical protein
VYIHYATLYLQKYVLIIHCMYYDQHVFYVAHFVTRSSNMESKIGDRRAHGIYIHNEKLISAPVSCPHNVCDVLEEDEDVVTVVLRPGSVL